VSYFLYRFLNFDSMISYYVHFAYGDAPRLLFLLLNFFCYILSVIRLSYPPSFRGFFYGYIFILSLGKWERIPSQEVLKCLISLQTVL